MATPVHRTTRQSRQVIALVAVNIVIAVPIIALASLVSRDLGRWRLRGANILTGANDVLIATGVVTLVASLTCLYRIGTESFFDWEGDKFVTPADQAASIKRWTNISSIATSFAFLMTLATFIAVFAVHYQSDTLRYSTLGYTSGDFTPESWYCQKTQEDSRYADDFATSCALARGARWLLIPSLFAIIPLAALAVRHWKQTRTPLASRGMKVEQGQEGDREQQTAQLQ